MAKLDFVRKVDIRLCIDQNEPPFYCTVAAKYSKSTQRIMNFSFLRHLRNPAD